MSAIARAMPSRFRPSALLDDRDDQALAVGELDREAEVDVVARDDLVAAQLAVDPRVVAQRLDRRARDEGQVRRVDAVRASGTPSSASCGSRPPSTCRPRSRSSRARRCRASGACARRSLAASRSSARPPRRLGRCTGAGAQAAPAWAVPRRRAAAAGGWRLRRGSRSLCGRGLRSCRLQRGRRSAGAAGAPDSTNARMSFFVTRPPRPVPGTWPTSTPCSDGDPRDDGRDEASSRRSRRRPQARARPARARERELPARQPRRRRLALGARRRLGLGRSLLRSRARAGASAAGGGASSASAPSGAITASFVPTSTVSPSWTRICCTTPVAGLGTSVSTLSVEISSSDSSASIVLALLLEPLRDRPLGDGDAHLGHDDVDRGVVAISTPPARESRPRRPRPAGCTPSRAAARTARACRAR